MNNVGDVNNGYKNTKKKSILVIVSILVAYPKAFCTCVTFNNLPILLMSIVLIFLCIQISISLHLTGKKSALIFLGVVPFPIMFKQISPDEYKIKKLMMIKFVQQEIKFSS